MITNEKLCSMAKEAYKYSYSPYSNFKVGAAVIDDNNCIHTGCNIENASFGGTICAERTAIVKAVSRGAKEIKTIAIASSSGKKTPPCGICLQVLKEFMREDGEVILYSEDGISKYKLSELLPVAFEFDK